MRKKIIAFLLLFLMTGVMLTGCGDDQKEKNEKVRIVVPDRVLTNKGMDAYTKQKQEEFDALYGDEIEVEHILPYQSADTNTVQNLTAVMLSNDAPAYVSVSSTTYMKDLYNMGIVADISDYVKDNEEFQKVLDNAVESCTYSDGSIIGYPTGAEVPLLGFYNEALVSAGYDPDTFKCDTWDDYYQLAKKMDTDGRNGASLYASEYFLWPQNWFLSNAAQLATQNEDGTISLNYTDDKVVETVEFLRKLYQEGLTNDKIGSLDLNGMFSLMYGKSVASFTFYPTWIDRFINQGIDPNEITLRMFPTGPSGAREPVMYVIGVVFNSALSEAELKAAIKYVSFMNSEENQKEMYQYRADNGISDLSISVVENVDWTVGLTDYPAQWIETIKQVMTEAKDNRLNATGYSTYISAKLPEMIEGIGDVKSALKEAEDLTRKEWLDDYNANLKK